VVQVLVTGLIDDDDNLYCGLYMLGKKPPLLLLAVLHFVVSLLYRKYIVSNSRLFIAENVLFLVDSLMYFIGYILYMLELEHSMRTGMFDAEQTATLG
jgi:hypothetical protein